LSDAILLRFLITLPLLLLSLVLHELAHGWVAWRLGDPTAQQQGRLSLNPLRQLDLWGSAMLVLTYVGSGGSFLFGWAKPVPIAPWHFKDPQRGMLWVGLAGPGANVALALTAAGLVWLTYTWSLLLAQAFAVLFVLNVVLAVFNLLPIPPLDGSRVLGGFLPAELYPRWLALDRWGNWVFAGLFLVLVAMPGLFNATLGVIIEWSFQLLPGG
jgi:Zn-dependent protease